MQFGIHTYTMDGAEVKNSLKDGIIKLLIILKNIKNTKNIKKGRFEATHFGSKSGPKSIKKRGSKKHSKNITIFTNFSSILVHKKGPQNSENTVQITCRELTEIH